MRLKTFAPFMMALSLTACATDFAGNEGPRGPLVGTNIATNVHMARADTLGAPFVQKGLEALQTGDYVEAQKGFNRALKFDPTNSQLHYLNGLTYHLRAAAGDSSQIEFAAIGYRLALRYDSANYWAAFQLGHINFADQRYREAQDAFAYALLYAPEDVTLLRALATASYYAQDLQTASAAITKVEKLDGQNPETLRIAAMVHAAVGQDEEARGFLDQYKATGDETALRRSQHLERRVNDWMRFHQRGGFQLAQSTSDILGDDNTSEGLAAPSGDDDSGGDDSSDDNSDATSSAKPKHEMTMVDVVIIRSEERNTTDKGVNLLSGLSATLGGTSFTFNSTRTENTGNATADSTVTTFTYNPTLSLSATYSLNIFNDNQDHNEVLARPSLIALHGKKSEFFTGAVFHVELDGVSGSQGTVTDVPVGIKLDVTPTFKGDDKVELSVSAARAFIEGRSSNIGFNNFAQITKTKVDANVVMKFGDTLILSGLTEKENEDLHDGVPFLQDIPGIQYFFSHEDTLEYTKSVLILLTPREPRYTYEDGSIKNDPTAPADALNPQPNLVELRNQMDWFRPAPNIDAVFQHMKDFRLFKEFRTGDVTLERWDTTDGLGNRIIRAVEFLYF